MRPVVGLLEDLLLVGDFDASAQLIAVLVREASGEGPTGATAKRQHAMTGIDVLIAGPMMRHITTHLATIDEAQFERVKTMCVSLGEVLVRPLAEALSVDERATPLFVYILGHVDHRGSLGVIYLRAIEQLGLLRDPSAVEPLRKALYKGEWWAPRRTAALRNAAAAALARIGTPEAFTVLDDAVAQGPRGVRSAARAQLATARRRDTRDTAAREGSA